MPVGTDTTPIIYVRSDKDTHFTGGIAQHAAEYEDIAFPHSMVGCNECVIEGIAILSDQNLAWDVYFFSSDGKSDLDLDLDTFIDFEAFANTTGLQASLTGGYCYATTGLAIPYRDADAVEDVASEFHIALVNRTATGKNEGATGEVVVMLMVRPIMFS